jgi:hypothetical protein
MRACSGNSSAAQFDAALHVLLGVTPPGPCCKGKGCPDSIAWRSTASKQQPHRLRCFRQPGMQRTCR